MSTYTEEEQSVLSDAASEPLSDSDPPPSFYDSTTSAASQPFDMNSNETNQEQVFTAAGRPMSTIKNSRPILPRLGDAHPVKFKDTSFIAYPIPQADIDEALAAVATSAEDDSLPTYGSINSRKEAAVSEKKSLLSVFKTSSKDKAPKKQSFQMVQMMRSEYRAYFAKGGKGEYICTVPRESGEWMHVLRMRLDDSELQKRGRGDTRFVNGGTWSDGIAFSSPMNSFFC